MEERITYNCIFEYVYRDRDMEIEGMSSIEREGEREI